ncbi:MAG: YigZ family protein [Mobilitalea sp.]
MKEAYKTVYQSGTGEFVVKKSRFIATICPVETEEKAIEIIDGLKKKYWDAAHNCSAYIIGADQAIMRCSDDGEPSKTAGKPMLDILISQELTNIVVIVTRYFGGTLLGTGGLVKAYQSAVLEGLTNCEIIKKELGIQFNIIVDYTAGGKLQYMINQEQLVLINSSYTDQITFFLLIPPSKLDFVTKKVAELTNGSATIEIFEQVYFSKFNNEVILF